MSKPLMSPPIGAPIQTETSPRIWSPSISPAIFSSRTALAVVKAVPSPTERMIACLRLLLAQVGVGERARRQWGALYEAYVATTPSEDEAATYLALERMGRHRIEQWLTALVDEGSIPPGGIEQRARFLATVTTGLMTERALPSDTVRIESETESLRLAVHAVTTGWATT